MKRLSISISVFLLLLLGACKAEMQKSSEVKEDTATQVPQTAATGEAVNCACGDMQCWRQATNDGVKDQLACAKDAMEKVVPILGPILDISNNIATMEDGVAGLSDVLQIAKEIATANAKAGGLPAELSCLVSIAKAFEGAFEPFKSLDKSAKLFTEGPSYENAKALGDMLKTTYDGASGFTALITRENKNCVVDPSKKELKEWHAKLNILKTKPLGFFQSFINRSKDLVKSPIDKINVAQTIYSCGARILKGARTLYANSSCLVDDLKALEDSKKAVARALAYEGTRQYNHARYIGCSQCVYSSYRDSTKTEYDKCRLRCETRVMNNLGAYQRSAWINSCQLTCGVARTEGLFWDYTDEAVCNEIKQMFPVSRMFRQLPLVKAGTPEADQRTIAQNFRARIVAALSLLEADFGHIAGLDQAGRPEFIEKGDLEVCRNSPTFRRELRDACALFTVEENSELFKLFDSAGDNNPDGFVGTTDIRYFHDEVSEYRDDSEYERASVEANLKGCADWGRDALKDRDWGCDFNKAFQRCGEHAQHRSSVVELFKPLIAECTGHCVQSWRTTNGC